MPDQTLHPLLPEATHDELARQNFVKSYKLHIATKIVPGNKTIYDDRVRPRFEAAMGRAPENRREVQKAMEEEPYYRMWGSLFRVSQEMSWHSVETSVERQIGSLNSKWRPTGRTLGTLVLDPALAIPPYLEAVDFHVMPGGYHREFAPEDVSMGAIYERGAWLYSMGGWGPMLDAMGGRIVSVVKETYPDFQPRQILEMGCSVGNSTLPYVDAFPDAQVHAIDVAAPLIRYGHSRAEHFGKRVHFAQQNCERTNFADASFDLVVSHILVHEMPAEAIRNTMRECFRLLKPGGMTLHVDLNIYRGLDVFDEAMLDWDSHYNNEPFWSVYRQMDPVALMTGAGFAAANVIQRHCSRVSNGSPVFQDGRNAGGRQIWYVLGARK